MILHIRYFLIIVVIIIIDPCKSTSAQETAIDSLIIQINSLSEDTFKVLELNKLSFKYLGFQIDTAYILGQRALDLSEKLNYEYGIAKSLFQLGLVLRYQSNYEKAIEYSTLSCELFDKLGKSSEKARGLNSLGNIYRNMGNYDKSLEYFLSSLKIYEGIQDSVKISYVLNNLGGLYYDMKLIDKSLDFNIQSLELKRKLGLKEKIPKALMSIGNIYRNKGDYAEALTYYKEALDLMDENTSKYDQLYLLTYLGSINQSLERFEIAENYYKKAIKIGEEVGEKNMLIYPVQGMGHILIARGDYDEGIKYLLKSYNLAVELGNLSAISKLSSSLSIRYENNNDYINSLKYYKIFQSANDSLIGLEKIKQITELEQKYEAEKRNQQIALLEKEKALQALENKQKSFQRNILIIVSVLAITLLAYYFRDSKRRKKINELLRKQNQKITDQQLEIAKQNDDLIESNNTKDRLLQIIAHDLRSPLVSLDSITQLIPFWVEDKDYESLNKLSSSMETSIHSVLSLIDNLLSWALNQQGKFPYKPENLSLKECIQEIMGVYQPIALIKHINLSFNIQGDVIVYADKNMLLTVLRNLLNNAIKFTRENGSIEVVVESDNQFARIAIKDTGIGIPEHKKDKIFEIAKGHSKGTKGEPGKGLGLFFCKEFVAMNKGNISVDSIEGKGTTITFTMPMADALAS